jgi:hypothetical protein
MLGDTDRTVAEAGNTVQVQKSTSEDAGGLFCAIVP